MCPITSSCLLRDTEGEEDEDYRNQEHNRSLEMSLQDIVNPPRPPPSPPPSQPPLSDDVSDPLIDDVSIPITAEIFDFCDDQSIFPDTLQSSEVTSSPNCCNYDQNHFQGDQNDHNGSTTSSTTTTATTITASNHHHNTGLSVIYDTQVDIDNDISASIDFSTPPLSYNLNYPATTFVDHIAISNGLSQYSTSQVDPAMALPMIGGQSLGLGTVYEEDCLSSIPPFLRAAVSSSSSCTIFDPTTISSFPSGSLNHGLYNDGSGIFGGSLFMGSELQAKELDFQGDNAGIFCHDQLGRYNTGDLQAFSNENSQLVNGATTSSGQISTEISSLDDSTYKVGKLSVEQRKEKIHRYLKKRNERNFSKKIKYACRKTLADSRPRVRGRFAKNDKFGEGHQHMNGHNEDDEYDEVAVKEEDEMVNSSDIFAHISGVNSFKCNYQIQSWI